MSATETSTPAPASPSAPTPEDASGAAHVVAQLDDLVEGAMTMVKADGRRICLVRTSSGVHAIDNACPHEGYGLAQGSLDGELVTCQWHNWKFRVTDGACTQGEEAVRTHDVTISNDGAVSVTVKRPDPAALVPQLMVSLRRGIERHYIGQISRDVIRLLKAGADPVELVWLAIEYGAPRAEDGWGHTIASAADCMAMIDLHDGDARALPVVQAIAGIAEIERGRPVNELPPPATGGPFELGDFRQAVEDEDLVGAQAMLESALAAGADRTEVAAWFGALVSDHLLSYGHGAIYAQKAFELLDVVGWERAPLVLGHLVPTLVYGTREDLLPYARPFTKVVDRTDLDALARVEADASWSARDTLIEVLLGDDRAGAATAAIAAMEAGAGVDGVLDACVIAVSERMLRYDTAGEFDFSDDFGWLDITHGLTYAHAGRWHHREAVQRHGSTTADMVRLALHCAFLANWTGRHEWHTSVGTPERIALGAPIAVAGADLQRRALLDGTSAFIVAAHAVKTSRAATREALHLGTDMPLQAAARFVGAPKLERFVARSVQVSLDFLNGRTQRD
jgi:nitrite reductase/ring-hydroxylating ferredoxin subunit